MKKLRSTDSVFSESNLSDFTNSNERNLMVTKTPKKDDLTINPLVLTHPHLAHHRMCERTKNINANTQRRNVESVKNEQLTPQQINPSTTPKLLHRASSKDLKNEEIKSASKARSQHTSGDASTSNDLNGTKIFENFNKDLLKSIKVGLIFLLFKFVSIFFLKMC